MDLIVILKNATLVVLDEHSTSPVLGGQVALNEHESAVRLTGATMRKLLDLAEPRDRTLDELLLRIAR